MRTLALLAISTFLVALVPLGEAQTTEPIRLVGDAALKARASSGSGTAASPYIIDENLVITATRGHGIEIRDTRAHAIIRGAMVVAGGNAYDGIRLTNVSNIVIEGADLQFNRYGIALAKSDGVVVRDSAIRASQIGILFEGTQSARVERNEIAVNEQDVAFRYSATYKRDSVKNTFRENNLSVATGQYGFHFGSTASFDNDIDGSNVVNFISMRWHTNLRGTATEPKAIVDELVDVKGMTNVAQVMCYNCSNVTIERVTGSVGRAAGLAIEAGDNITVISAFAEGNEGAGVEVRNSKFVRVSSSSLYQNKPGVHVFGSRNVTLIDVRANANNQHGIVFQYGTNNTISASSAEQTQGDGILLDRTNDTRLTLATVAENTGDGLRIVGGRNASVEDGTARGNRGEGVEAAEGAFNTTIRGWRLEDNLGAGVALGRDAVFARVEANHARNNSLAGIHLSSAGVLNRIQGNELSDQPRHIRLTRSAQSVFDANTMTTGPGQTGIWFDDETSYNNTIGTSNLVDGTPVQWHVAPAGSPLAPLVLRGIRVETPNMTNVAQVMLYKGSYIELRDTIASNGVRGIYTLRSSSIIVEDAILQENGIGLDLRGTQTGEVRRIASTGGNATVLMPETLNVTVRDVAGPGARIVVDIESSARGSIVERIDATGAGRSVREPSAATSTPRHLIVDAGLDKLIPRGKNVTFNDTIGVARYGSERVVRQEWDLGDGSVESSDAAATLRPVHAYDIEGNYTATYTLETADGRVLSDTVRVRVVAPPPPPADLIVNITGGKAQLNWSIVESEFPTANYTVYRGLEPDNLTKMLVTVNNGTLALEKFNATLSVYYAVTATAFGGESELSEPILALFEVPKPPAPPEEEEEEVEPEVPAAEIEAAAEAKTPVPAALGLAALALVAALRRRA